LGGIRIRAEPSRGLGREEGPEVPDPAGRRSVSPADGLLEEPLEVCTGVPRRRAVERASRTSPNNRSRSGGPRTAPSKTAYLRFPTTKETLSATRLSGSKVNRAPTAPGRPGTAKTSSAAPQV
jgi:hypothetical protein